MGFYLGDYLSGDTQPAVVATFNTVDSNGADVTATGGTVNIYENNGTTPIATNGATLTRDAYGTGRHKVSVDVSAAGYTDGNTYEIEVAGLTVDGQSVSAFVGTFTRNLPRRANLTQFLGQAPDNNPNPSNVLEINGVPIANLLNVNGHPLVALTAINNDTGSIAALNDFFGQGRMLTDSGVGTVNTASQAFLANGAHGGAAATITLGTPIEANAVVVAPAAFDGWPKNRPTGDPATWTWPEILCVGGFGVFLKQEHDKVGGVVSYFDFDHTTKLFDRPYTPSETLATIGKPQTPA